jgi:CIC family chloride channel protein
VTDPSVDSTSTAFTLEHALDSLKMGIYAVIVGLVVGYASLGLLLAIEWLQRFFVGASPEQMAHEAQWWRLAALPVLGAALVSWLLSVANRKRSPADGPVPDTGMQRNYGPADVIEAARAGESYVSLRTGITNALAAILSIGSGASVGRYGPAVHLGATLGSFFSRRLHLPAHHRRALLACGVAAAISASFSAPLAGVVFAHEVVLGTFGARMVMPIVVASVVANTVARVHHAGAALLSLPDLPVQHPWEFAIFALVGVIGGLLALAFMGCVTKLGELADRYRGPHIVRAVVLGLALGGLVAIFPQTFGLGEDPIRSALSLELSVATMLGLVVAKMLATSVSLAAGFAGGVLGPALFIGAMMGASVGMGVNLWQPDASSASIYAVAGMGAVISRVVGAPIATILIAFELTSSYALTTAVMVSVVVGGTVTNRFFNRSFFYSQLRTRGFEPDEPREQRLLRATPVRALMVEPTSTLRASDGLAEARQRVVTSSHEETFVVGDGNRLLGELDNARVLQIEGSSTDMTVADLCRPVQHVLHADTDVFSAIDTLQDFVGTSVPVVQGDDGAELVGIVFEGRLMTAYLEAVNEAREEERLA